MTSLRLFTAAFIACVGCATSARSGDSLALDHRYAPSAWQTAICLPDDWQKTLVHKDGALLYDYGGKHAGFGTRISFQVEGDCKWIKQELVSARVPIVRTFQSSGAVQITQEAFAASTQPAAAGRQTSFVVERLGSQTVNTGWASPPAGTDRAFANIAVGWQEPVRFRFKAGKNLTYVVGFGLCEGHHDKAGSRILELQVEGKTRRTVDLVAARGRNQPQVFLLAAKDENGDGWVDLAVAAAVDSPDQNSILNTLWVFNEADAPVEKELVAGGSRKAPLAQIHCGEEFILNKPARRDVLLVRLRNSGNEPARIAAQLKVETSATVLLSGKPDSIRIGSSTVLSSSEQLSDPVQTADSTLVKLAVLTLPPRAEKLVAIAVDRGNRSGDYLFDVAHAEKLRKQAQRYWEKLELPYGRLQVPDAGVQNMIDSSVRNIYQAREIKKGLPAFQVGPTCYRGLWVVDGSFLLEAVTYVGRPNETRQGIKYLMSFQRPDGGFMIIDGHWKETGIVLWAIARHAQLTGDKEWLRQQWPSVQRGVAFIKQMRGIPAAGAVNARLIPDGFSDGGLSGRVPEYTNIYWTLAGLKAAIEAAMWLGCEADANDWRSEFDDFLVAFRQAAERDLRKDTHGNNYLPIRMTFDPNMPPQKAQWAFLHAIFPGKVLGADDPLVQGNMAMLKSVEAQDLVLDTGWLKDGIWTYFGSFYGHALLWLGQGEKAARTLYAFGNHASPLLAWREEQMPVGAGDGVVGDMPHNWASAEFIRLVRHCLILERGSELHLLEAMPASWTKPGAVTRATDMATSFGPVFLEVRVQKDGKAALIKVTPPRRVPPEKIILHLGTWSGHTGTMTLPTAKTSTCSIKLGRE